MTHAKCNAVKLCWPVLCLVLGCAGKTASTAGTGNERPWSFTQLLGESAADRYLLEEIKQSPSFSRYAGFHDHDGIPTPVGPAVAAAEVARARKHLAETQNVLPTLTRDPARLDLELTRLLAESVVFQVEDMRSPHRILTYTDGFDVSGYVQRAYAPLRVRAFSVVEHLERATAQVDTVLSMLDAEQPRTHLETARLILKGTTDYLEHDVTDLLKPALDQDAVLRARFEKARAGAAGGVTRLLGWVESALTHANEDFRLGTPRFLRMLQVNEGLSLTLEELRAMADADFSANRQALEQVAAQLFPGVPVAEAVQRVASEKVPADKVLSTAEQQAQALRAFLLEKKLITIPGTDVARVTVTPPFMRFNSAFLNSPGPFEEVSRVSFYYITPPDPTWDAAKQNGYLPFAADLLATTIHEVYPGHFVQGLHQQRAASTVQKVLHSYAFGEGWAHYAEQMVLDAGYVPTDLKARVGQLTNALLRNCRFLAALGLHTGSMTVDEAKKLFMEQCLVDEGNAEQQAYRGTYDPGYFSYTLGKLQLMKLRERFLKKRGTQDWGAFHNWVLSMGSPPLGLLESRL